MPLPSDLSDHEILRTLADRAAIEDVMSRYARGVDRSDFDLVRSAYHPGAYDDHGDFRGQIEDFIPWLAERLDGAIDGMHLLGNCLIEFAGPEVALVETYFVSHRLRKPTGDERPLTGPDDLMSRQRWGRYVDRFERRDGEWRVASRTVVWDSSFDCIALNGAKRGAGVWGQRNSEDHSYLAQSAIFGAGSGAHV